MDFFDKINRDRYNIYVVNFLFSYVSASKNARGLDPAQYT